MTYTPKPEHIEGEKKIQAERAERVKRVLENIEKKKQERMQQLTDKRKRK